MSTMLEGGCRVTGLRDGEPERSGNLRVWRHFGKAHGADAISLRVVEIAAAGLSPAMRAEVDDVLYVLEGSGSGFVDGRRVPLLPGSGLYLAPGTQFAVDNQGPEPLVLVGSRCPDPGAGERGVDLPPVTATAPAHEKAPLVRLGDRAALPTGDRWYRLLVDADVGSTRVTQFVGSIPPGRAPDHFHHYEEVLCILSGQGRMWAGATSTTIGRGSCVFLPRKQIHCVENTGSDELRLLGVFYPAGSPAVRYDAASP